MQQIKKKTGEKQHFEEGQEEDKNDKYNSEMTSVETIKIAILESKFIHSNGNISWNIRQNTAIMLYQLPDGFLFWTAFVTWVNWHLKCTKRRRKIEEKNKITDKLEWLIIIQG